MSHQGSFSPHLRQRHRIDRAFRRARRKLLRRGAGGQQADSQQLDPHRRTFATGTWPVGTSRTTASAPRTSPTTTSAVRTSPTTTSVAQDLADNDVRNQDLNSAVAVAKGFATINGQNNNGTAQVLNFGGQQTNTNPPGVTADRQGAGTYQVTFRGRFANLNSVDDLAIQATGENFSNASAEGLSANPGQVVIRVRLRTFNGNNADGRGLLGPVPHPHDGLGPSKRQIRSRFGGAGVVSGICCAGEARPGGFEPPTSRSGGERSIH